MADIFRDQDHNLNKILNADLTLIDPFLLPTGVLLSADVIGGGGIAVIDNGDGTITIGASGPSGPLIASIDDLTDVDVGPSGPSDGQVLTWDAALGQWVPSQPGGGLGYRERFNVLDPATQLPLRVVHNLDVVTGVVDVTVAEMGPPTRLIQADVTILDANTIDVMLQGVTTGSFEVLVLAEGEGGATGPSGPALLLDEVFVGATDPFVTDPSSTAELWYTPLGATYPTGPTIPTGILRASVNGVWEVVGGVAALDDLTDVTTSGTGPSGPTGPSDGQVLVWDAALGQWVPGEGATAEAEVEVGPTAPAGEWELWVDTSGLTPPPGTVSLTIDDLIDVDTATTPPAVGDVLVWDGTAWVPGASTLDALTDVDTTTTAPIDGHGLGWSSTASNWVPQPTWGMWSGTQAEYDAIPTKNPGVLYAII